MTQKILIKYIYIFICKTYQILVGYYEKVILKNNLFNKEFENTGVFILKDTHIDITDIINIPKKNINKYSSLRILKYNQIVELINNVFTYEVKKQITEITGFKYTIDYLIFYDRLHIHKNDFKEDNGALSVLNQWYAYNKDDFERHFDVGSLNSMVFHP